VGTTFVGTFRGGGPVLTSRLRRVGLRQVPEICLAMALYSLQSCILCRKLAMVLTVGAMATRQGFSPPFSENSHLYTSSPIVLARICGTRDGAPGCMRMVLQCLRYLLGKSNSTPVRKTWLQGSSSHPRNPYKEEAPSD